MGQKKFRIMIAKVGLDGHDRGAKLIARALSDAGMEVIYTGIRQSVDAIVAAAVQEDIAAVGLSFLSGDHMVLVPKIMQRLKQEGADDLPVVVGGIILQRDITELLATGVSRVFLPGTQVDEIIDYFKSIELEKGD